MNTTQVNLFVSGQKYTTMTFDHLPRVGDGIVSQQDGSKYSVLQVSYNISRDGQGNGTCQSIDLYLEQTAP
jgi:hypothetical protein